jgi:hypothetical protein
MENLEVFLGIMTFLTLLISFTNISIGLYFLHNNKNVELENLNNQKIFKLTTKAIFYGPFSYKVFSKYQKENENDN